MSALRRIVGTVAAVLLAGVAAVALAAPASAHNVLTGSDPADGSTPTTAPAAVTLTFDEAVQNYEPVLVVTGPDGTVFSTATPAVSGTTVRTDLLGAGPAGAYTVAFRIVSADGHPVSGQFTYTLAAGAAGTATGSPAPAGGVSTGPTEDGGSGGSIWLWVGVGVAAVLVVAAVVLILRRPDTSED